MSRGGFFSMMMRCALLLALIAVGQRTVLPNGLMLQNTGTAGVEMVLCTGNGPVSVEADPALVAASQDKDKAPAKGPAHDAPCAFAGQAVGGSPPQVFEVRPAAYVAYLSETVGRSAYLAPGRGLTAPPMPPRGPPSLAI